MLKHIIRRILLNEAYIDQDGKLKDFSFGLYYPFDEMKPMIEWFYEEYGDYAISQGWTIFRSDSDYPLQKYDNKKKGFWQIEKIDDPEEWMEMEGIQIVNPVINDMEADERAKELGLIVDEFGVVQGFGDRNYVEEYNYEW